MKKYIIIILVTVLLFSCGEKESNDFDVKEKVTNVYKMTPLKLPDNVISGNSFVIQEDAVYVLCTQEMENIVYKIGFDGKVIDSTPIVNDESTYITSYQRFNDGKYIVLYQFYDGTVSYTLKIYSENDELLSEIDVTSKANQEVGNAYFSYMKTDDENNIYLGGNSYLLVLSENGDKIYDNIFGPNSYINNIGETKDNKIYVNYSDYSANGITKMEIIDIAGKALIPISIPDKYNTYEYTVYFGPEYDFYFKDSIGLYGYKTETDELTLLANWMNSDITDRFVNNITIISPDCFIFTGYNQIKQRNQLNIMNRIPDDEVKEKYIIRISTLGDTTTLSIAAVQFNIENDEYRVVIDQLKQDNNTEYAEWRELILNNYINGNIPDIISIENDMAYQNLMDQGAFVDLYEYLDNDPDINRDSLFNCVRIPFERNGKLYQLFTSFNIQTLSAKTDNVKDITKWNIAGAIDFIESLPDGVSFTENDSMDMMSNIFLSRGFDSFIDYDNATCNFDNEDFHKILNLLKNYGVADYTVYRQMIESGEIANNYKNNKIIFSSTSLGSFSSYLQLKVKFNLEDITFMGFPSSNGNGSIIIGTSYAISSKSPHKEGAWKFLKYLLRDDIQNIDRYSYSFPSPISAFYKRTESEMKTIYSFHSSNSYSTRHLMEDEEIPLNESADNMAITQEDVDFLVEFFNSEVSVFRYDMSLVNIIYEELIPFIEGTKSLEETVKIIQSRALVYMNENYS